MRHFVPANARFTHALLITCAAFALSACSSDSGPSSVGRSSSRLSAAHDFDLCEQNGAPEEACSPELAGEPGLTTDCVADFDACVSDGDSADDCEWLLYWCGDDDDGDGQEPDCITLVDDCFGDGESATECEAMVTDCETDDGSWDHDPDGTADGGGDGDAEDGGDGDVEDGDGGDVEDGGDGDVEDGDGGDGDGSSEECDADFEICLSTGASADECVWIHEACGMPCGGEEPGTDSDEPASEDASQEPTGVM